MKILVTALALIAVAFSYFYLNPSAIQVGEITTEAPERPTSVPEDAFWVGGLDGGSFIRVTSESSDRNVIFAEIYNDDTGDIEYSGPMNYSGQGSIPETITDPSFFIGWDGNALHLSNGHSFVAVDH